MLATSIFVGFAVVVIAASAVYFSGFIVAVFAKLLTSFNKDDKYNRQITETDEFGRPVKWETNEENLS